MHYIRTLFRTNVRRFAGISVFALLILAGGWADVPHALGRIADQELYEDAPGGGYVEQCANGVDDDGNGFTDYSGGDPGCSSAADDYEISTQAPAQCADGLDNDSDGTFDGTDAGCTDATDDTENSENPAPPPPADAEEVPWSDYSQTSPYTEKGVVAFYERGGGGSLICRTTCTTDASDYDPSCNGGLPAAVSLAMAPAGSCGGVRSCSQTCEEATVNAYYGFNYIEVAALYRARASVAEGSVAPNTEIAITWPNRTNNDTFWFITGQTMDSPPGCWEDSITGRWNCTNQDVDTNANAQVQRFFGVVFDIPTWSITSSNNSVISCNDSTKRCTAVGNGTATIRATFSSTDAIPFLSGQRYNGEVIQSQYDPYALPQKYVEFTYTVGSAATATFTGKEWVGGTAPASQTGADDTLTVQQGDKARVYWSSTPAAASCTASSFNNAANSIWLGSKTPTAGGQQDLTVSLSPGTYTLYLDCAGVARKEIYLTVQAPPNNPPAAPSVSCSASTAVGSPATMTLQATDPDGNQIRYGYDWNDDGNPLITDWMPQPNPSPATYVNSGTRQTSSHTFATAGTYTIYGWAQDTVGATSNRVSCAITVTAAPVASVDLTATPNAIVTGGSSQLRWSSSNVTSCTGVGFVTGGATQNAGGVSVSPTVTTTYTINCTGPSGNASDSETVTVSGVPTQCNDGVDNADTEDTLADASDPGCFRNDTYDPTDTSEVDVPPSKPTMTCPAGTVNTGTSFQVTLTGTDPNNNSIRYGIDYNGSPLAATDWMPQPNPTPATYVPSGTAQTFTIPGYGTAGTYTVYGWTQNKQGLISQPVATPASCTVTVVAPAAAWITADPVQLCNGATLGSTTVRWFIPGPSNATVWADDAGNFAYMGPGTYSAETGVWVANGSTFVLRDGQSPTKGTVLASTTVVSTNVGCPPPPGTTANLTITNVAPTNNQVFTNPTGITFRGTAQNIGTGPTAAGQIIYADVEIDWNDTTACTAAVADVVRQAGSSWSQMAAGATRSPNPSVNIARNALENGTHCYRMVVDRNGLVDETNDADNAGPWYPFTVILPECSDGTDNDADGQTDYPSDSSCSNATDSNEAGQCLGTFADATLCAGDDAGLSSDQSSTLVTGCSIPSGPKCEWQCTAPSQLVPDVNRCVLGTITANPQTVQASSTSQITWAVSGSTNGLTCNVESPEGGIPATDSWTGTSGSNRTTSPIVADTTFTLVCNGVAIRSTTVGTYPPPTLTANPRVIDIGGGSTLTWNLNGNTSCVLTGGGLNRSIGPTQQGTQAVSGILGETKYTITCGGGSSSVIVETREQGHET